MSDNNSAEDIFNGETNSGSDNSVAPLQVIDETKYLDSELGKLLLEIYEQREATLDDLAQSVDPPAPQTKRNLSELRKQGYLGVNYESNEKRYYVRNDWSTQEFPSGPIIPLVYQFNLLSDTQRMETLHEAINRTVQQGDVVADLGAGVGFLSCVASQKANKVHAIEIDREVYEKGNQILEHAGIENVNYIRGDAREVELPTDVDVVLCELLDTGLIAELQVPVMNYVIEEFAGPDVRTVPVDAKTSMRLVEADYTFYDYEFRIPHFEEYGSRESEPRSEKQTYHQITFKEQNSELVEQRVTLYAMDDGVINGIQLNTEVRFAPGMEYTGASPWLNPPLNLPFERDIEVEEGDTITVEITYELGGGLNNIVYEVIDR